MVRAMNMHSHHCTRRDFLARSVKSTISLCAATALVPLVSRAANPPAARRAATPRFGFTTYQWGKDWDIPTLLANLQKAQVFGVELRTSMKYAHGVELTLQPAQRREVRQRFADSPVQLVGLASGERYDSPDAAKLQAAIEATKRFLQLSHDIGAGGVRVFPNDFPKDVPRETTLAQIARAMNTLGPVAAGLGQQLRLEAHGSAGELATLRAIMDQVTAPSVRLKLNSDARDTRGEGFEANFNLVKAFLGDTLHLHNLKDTKFPYQLQTDLLVKMNWGGWALLEASDAVPDRLQALIEQREIWDKLMANAQGR